MYTCYQVERHHIPFPKDGFQKFDVITPIDKEDYGRKFMLIGFVETTKDPTRNCPYYYYELEETSLYGRTRNVNPQDLRDKYKFVYSEKSFKISNDLENLGEKVDKLIKEVNSLDKEYKLNTTHIINSLEQIKLQIKHLE